MAKDGDSKAAVEEGEWGEGVGAGEGDEAGDKDREGDSEASSTSTAAEEERKRREEEAARQNPHEDKLGGIFVFYGGGDLFVASEWNDKEDDDAKRAYIEKKFAKGEYKEAMPHSQSVSGGAKQYTYTDSKGQNLVITEKDGKFDVSSASNFTGVMKLQRKDAQGNLIDSHDIIEFKDGKVVGASYGKDGQSRLGNLPASPPPGLEIRAEHKQDASVRVWGEDRGGSGAALSAAVAPGAPTRTPQQGLFKRVASGVFGGVAGLAGRAASRLRGGGGRDRR